MRKVYNGFWTERKHPKLLYDRWTKENRKVIEDVEESKHLGGNDYASSIIDDLNFDVIDYQTGPIVQFRPRTLACHASNMGSNPIVTPNREVVQSGRIRALGACGRRFESCLPYHVSVAEWQGNGLQIRFLQVRILSDTPQACSSVGQNTTLIQWRPMVQVHPRLPKKV